MTQGDTGAEVGTRSAGGPGPADLPGPGEPLALAELAAVLPDAWRSRGLGRVGSTAVKVARMDGLPLAEESHPTAEALLVLDGLLALEVAGEPVSVRAGELFLVPAHTPHRVGPGSTGTLLIVEAEAAGN
ncbi:cupin domain-containing protein [Streptomyces sp. HSW2009]|uniref:cupin domain-containing protein n=1 Tax=Streptomyces sp. HSW2009 TaxID=3142890 RepID=UPI0032EFA6FB